MKIIIAAGCPDSGWENIVSQLADAGLGIEHQEITTFHKQFFESKKDLSSNCIYDALTPDDVISDKLKKILQNSSNNNILIFEPLSISLLEFWSSLTSDIIFLLFYTSPGTAFMQAISQGVDPLHFQDRWLSYNKRLIKFHSEHRPDCILLDANAAANNQEKFKSLLEKSGIKIPSELKHIANTGCHESSGLEFLLINNFASNKQVKAMHAELDAGAQALGSSDELNFNESEKLLDAYNQVKNDLWALNTKLESMTEKNEENSLLLLQLYQIEKELGEKSRELEENSKELKENSKELKENSKVIHELKNEDIQKDRRLSEKIFSFQKLSHEKMLLEKSMYWKMTSPIRSVLMYFSRISYKKETKHLVDLLNASELFDDYWYLETYSDVADSGVDPVEHYLEFGVFEGRDPSATFNTRYYLENYPDVVASNINPLVHYITHGINERRTTMSNSLY